jgi:16S rRNA (guanine(1405)-N(7))-methyltransferase
MRENPDIPSALDRLLDDTVREMARRYRIVPDAARRVLEKHLRANRKLAGHLSDTVSLRQISRLHEFKQTVKEAKKEIYYNLRKYHRDKEAEGDLVDELRRRVESGRSADDILHIRDELLLMHSSTAERYDHYSAFYETLFSITQPPQSILDIACGLHPLSYPFDESRPRIYMCVDRDNLCIDAVRAFAPCCVPVEVKSLQEDLADLAWNAVTDDALPGYDLCFMLKLVPVVARQDEYVLKKLTQVPAQQILITGSTEALAKKQDVSRREDRVLRDFIRDAGRSIVAEFRIPTEFGYLTE